MICNSFELSGLWLTLVRCNLDGKKCKDLIDNLKVNTRLSNLGLA